MTRTRSAYDVETAFRIYEMWHQKEPRELVETPPFNPPRRLFAVGEPIYIVYLSDKWEPDGTFIKYIHKFTSHPSVWASTGELFDDGSGFVEANDHVPATDIVPQFIGGYGRAIMPASFPLLAKTVSLTYLDLQGRKRKISFQSHDPIMSCTVDRDAVLVFSDELLVIHGGNTRVLADGIAY